MKLRALPDRLAVCRLSPGEPVPGWTEGPGFASVTRTAEELSVIAPEARVPDGVRCDRGWRALELEGPIPLSEVGVLAVLASVLASARIPIFAISTFDTDYVLVREDNFLRAKAALDAAGHTVASGPGLGG